MYFVNDLSVQFTKDIATLDRICTDEAVESIIAGHSRVEDAIVLTDG